MINSIILLSCLLLSGCYQNANNSDLHKAVYFCGSIENVEFVRVWAAGTEVVRCLDGSIGSTHKIKIKEEKDNVQNSNK